MKNTSINPFDYKNNHGRRTITIQERMQAIEWLNSFVPKTKKEERDKVILEYFLKENLSAFSIARKQDERIVSFGNRSKGNPLCNVAILAVINHYFPQFKNRMQRGKDNKYRERIDLRMKRRKQPTKHVKQCAFCGISENLEEHHMIPLAIGGTNDEENLVYMCKKHHKEVSVWTNKLMKRI